MIVKSSVVLRFAVCALSEVNESLYEVDFDRLIDFPDIESS